jgi:glucokinase
VWRDAVEALGATLAAAVGLIGPDVIVVGGGLATSGDVLLAPLRDAIAARLAVQQPPAVVPAALGDLAGARGAGLLALDLMEVAS